MEVWILEPPVEGGIVRLSYRVSYTYCLELIEVPNMVYRITMPFFVATTAAAVAVCLLLTVYLRINRLFYIFLFSRIIIN